MLRAVVFDFDGTLMPLSIDFTAMRAEVEKLARNYFPEEIIEAHAGLYLLETIEALSAGLDAHRAEAFSREAHARICTFEVRSAREKALYPFTRTVLAGLRQKGLGIGVITRNCRAAVLTVLPDIDDYADGLVTREDTDRVKPHPGHVETILHLLHCSPREALLVGDHPTDVMAGTALSMVTVAVLSGRTTRDDFARVHPAFIVDDIRGLAGIIPSVAGEAR